jgi:hypothetical protein
VHIRKLLAAVVAAVALIAGGAVSVTPAQATWDFGVQAPSSWELGPTTVEASERLVQVTDTTGYFNGVRFNNGVICYGDNLALAGYSEAVIDNAMDQWDLVDDLYLYRNGTESCYGVDDSQKILFHWYSPDPGHAHYNSCAFTAHWTYPESPNRVARARVYINRDRASSCTFGNDARKANLIGHEAGHAFGLGHDDTRTDTIMRTYEFTPTWATYWDLQKILALYPW